MIKNQQEKIFNNFKTQKLTLFCHHWQKILNIIKAKIEILLSQIVSSSSSMKYISKLQIKGKKKNL